MKSVVFFSVLLLMNAATFYPQAAKSGQTSAPKQTTTLAPEKPAVAIDQTKPKVEELVLEWFKRWNALDGSKESIDRFVDLYKPDAVLLMSPRENQIGPAFYDGHDLIRKMAEELSKQYKRMAFFIKSRTEDEKTAEVITTTQAPWGATAAAVEFGGSWDLRENGKRFMVPGAAFFEFKDGKISRLRIYYAGGEIAPIVGSGTR